MNKLASIFKSRHMYPSCEMLSVWIGSSLELELLRTLKKHGFYSQKQMPMPPNEGEALVSIADFAVREKRIAIFVDGSAFCMGAKSNRSRKVLEKLLYGDRSWEAVELVAGGLRANGELRKISRSFVLSTAIDLVTMLSFPSISAVYESL